MSEQYQKTRLEFKLKKGDGEDCSILNDTAAASVQFSVADWLFLGLLGAAWFEYVTIPISHPTLNDTA
jgi:hypothetical protein